MNPTSLLSGLGAAITAEPTLGANGTGRAPASGTGDLFMALVAGLLDDQGAGTPAAAAGEAAPSPDGEPVPGQPVAVEPTDTDAEQPTDADVLPDAVPTVLPVVLPPALLAQALAPTTPPTAAAVEGGEPAPASAPAATPAVADATVAGGTAPATDTQADAGQDTGGDAGTPSGTAGPAAPTAATTPAGAGSAGPAPVSAVGAAAPATPAAPVATASAPAVQRVTEQVFPEIVRATGGTVEGGPHRVTVKLNPESLGEVRIVLTQRRGELEVSLAAGQDARRALAEGAPELHRLLESIGRADSRVVFRDLPSTSTVLPPAQADAARADVSTDLGGSAWSGAGRPGGESAADRDQTRQYSGSTTATDGTTSATSESRPVTTAGRSHSGVDLTM